MTMRSRLLVWALVFAGLLCLVQPNQPRAWWQSIQQVSIGGSPPPAFSGVFDIAACGTNCDYWGTRAASVADKGNRLMNVCNVADVACADLSSDATTGDLVIGTIGGSSCSIITCTVKTLYGRGTAFCSGYTTACDLTQATIATRPTLVVNCASTGKPCLACDGSQQLLNSTISAETQAFSLSTVAERTGNTSNYGLVIVSSSGSVQIAFNNAVNQAYIYAGLGPSPATANDNVIHAIQGLFNAASSVQRIDNSSGSVSIGTTGLTTDLSICNGGGSNFLTGNFFEAVAWKGDLSANFAALYANQKAYWSGIP